MNNTDGGTWLNINNKKILIKCVENRALIFDSGKNHQSTTCTDQDVRMNININWI
jgi:hypothetical protein